MHDPQLTGIIAGSIASILAFVLTKANIRLSWKLGLIDDPKTHKHVKVIHQETIPRSGGIAIFASFALTSILFLPIDQYLLAILTGGVIIVIMGVIDDKLLGSGKKDFSPLIRLGMQFLAALIPVLVGVKIAFISNPTGGIFDFSEVFSKVIAVLWIVFMMNILNLGAKGVPGQLTGITVIASLVIAVLSLKFSADITQWPVFVIACITAGSFFGFLPWHIEPQKIMPSFSGSNLAGYLLAIMTILSTTKIGTLLVVMAIPVIDTGYVVLRRIIAGKSPLHGDRSHLHHRLLDAGLSKNQVAIFYWSLTGILGLLAVNLNTLNKLYTIILVGAAVGLLILCLSLQKPSKEH